MLVTLIVLGYSTLGCIASTSSSPSPSVHPTGSFAPVCTLERSGSLCINDSRSSPRIEVNCSGSDDIYLTIIGTEGRVYECTWNEQSCNFSFVNDNCLDLPATISVACKHSRVSHSGHRSDSIPCSPAGEQKSEEKDQDNTRDTTEGGASNSASAEEKDQDNTQDPKEGGASNSTSGEQKSEEKDQANTWDTTEGGASNSTSAEKSEEKDQDNTRDTKEAKHWILALLLCVVLPVILTAVLLCVLLRMKCPALAVLLRMARLVLEGLFKQKSNQPSNDPENHEAEMQPLRSTTAENGTSHGGAAFNEVPVAVEMEHENSV